jgi:hypothetical protein
MWKTVSFSIKSIRSGKLRRTQYGLTGKIRQRILWCLDVIIRHSEIFFGRRGIMTEEGDCDTNLRQRSEQAAVDPRGKDCIDIIFGARPLKKKPGPLCGGMRAGGGRSCAVENGLSQHQDFLHSAPYGTPH